MRSFMPNIRPAFIDHFIKLLFLYKQNLTGYTKAEVVGKNLRILKSGRHDKAFYGAIWESILRIGSWKGEIWDRRKNGEHFLCWLSIAAVKASDGGITHYVATHIDITERKKAEKLLEAVPCNCPVR